MSGVAVDLTITLGNIIEVLVIGGGGISALAVMKNTIITLKREVSEGKRETNAAIFEMKQDAKDQFNGIQLEIKKIGDVLINQADQNRRLIHLEDDMRELKHGRGFIRGPLGIDREYPG